MIEKLTHAVVDVLGSESLSAHDKRQRMEELVYAAIDFETLSRLVLARNWSRFTPEQRQEFVRQFREHLSLTYGKNLESYKNERIAIESEREEPGGDWTVKSRILRGGANDILIDYRLRKTGDQWEIIDFIIERISLVANYRAQFQDILSSSTPEKLLQLLRDKNERGDPLKAPKA